MIHPVLAQFTKATAGYQELTALAQLDHDSHTGEHDYLWECLDNRQARNCQC